jgi:transcriptional regulator with XRE-family HTH domain
MQTAHLGERLRRARLARGWTQAELAYAAGMAMPSISELERSEQRRPRRTTIRCLALALGVTESALTGAGSETDLLTL